MGPQFFSAKWMVPFFPLQFISPDSNPTTMRTEVSRIIQSFLRAHNDFQNGESILRQSNNSPQTILSLNQARNFVADALHDLDIMSRTRTNPELLRLCRLGEVLHNHPYIIVINTEDLG